MSISSDFLFAYNTKVGLVTGSTSCSGQWQLTGSNATHWLCGHPLPALSDVA